MSFAALNDYRLSFVFFRVDLVSGTVMGEASRFYLACGGAWLGVGACMYV